MLLPDIRHNRLGGDTPERLDPEEKRSFRGIHQKRVLAACTGKTEQEQTTCVSEKAGVRSPCLAGLLLRFVG